MWWVADSYHIEWDTALKEESLGAMLWDSTLGDTQQIVGEAAYCSDWTRMEGQGSWNVQQFRLKYRLVYLYVLRCYVKYKDLFWETGDRQLFHIQISAFQNRVWEIVHKSMVVYLISNITVWIWPNLTEGTSKSGVGETWINALASPPSGLDIFWAGFLLFFSRFSDPFS